MKCASFIVLAFCALPAPGQLAAEATFCWNEIDAGNAALWCGGVQVGALDVETLTYYPRYGPGRWGQPEDPPAPIPRQYVARYNEWSAQRANWREQGIRGANGSCQIPNTGLHINKRQTKTSAVQAGADEVPAYQLMASLTFVSAGDGSAADAALTQFQTAPELQVWRKKFGPRAKAYSLEDFQHTCSAFKLDQDRTFAKTGFVALVQPDAPDADDKAAVHSLYEFVSPAQFAGALRDIDPKYDPNPPEEPALSGEWQPWHYAASGALALLTFALAGCAAAHRRRV